MLEVAYTYIYIYMYMYMGVQKKQDMMFQGTDIVESKSNLVIILRLGTPKLRGNPMQMNLKGGESKGPRSW